MVFVGHLDTMRTFDRACRRAALPVSADESPFAVRQRIYAALPLSLGATSSGEWLEVMLTERFDPEVVRQRLQVRAHGRVLLCVAACNKLCSSGLSVLLVCGFGACTAHREGLQVITAHLLAAQRIAASAACGPALPAGPAAAGAGAAVS